MAKASTGPEPARLWLITARAKGTSVQIQYCAGRLGRAESGMGEKTRGWITGFSLGEESAERSSLALRVARNRRTSSPARGMQFVSKRLEMFHALLNQPQDFSAYWSLLDAGKRH